MLIIRKAVQIIAIMLWITIFTVGIASAQDSEPFGRIIDSDTLIALYDQPTGSNIAYIAPNVTVRMTGRTSDANWVEVRTLSGLSGWVELEFVDHGNQLGQLPIKISNSEDDALEIFPFETLMRLQTTYQKGQLLGNNPNVFVKVGDSITVSQNFLTQIGYNNYDLGKYTELEEVIDHFNDEYLLTGNSFSTQSIAAGVGWAAGSLLMSANANSTVCQQGESPLVCAYRVHKPAYALIMVGTNDTAFISPSDFRANLERIVEISLERGVIPIVSTIPDRLGYENLTNEFNEIIREVVAINNLPLWDYGGQMAQLPNYGLTSDNIHPSTPPGGIDNVARFNENTLQYGYTLRNLSALQILDDVWRAVDQP